MKKVLLSLLLILASSSALAAPPGFSDPITGYTISPSNLLFQSLSEVKSVSLASQDTVVYKYGYYSLAGEPWQQFTLSGTTSGEWIIGGGSATLSIPGNKLIDGTGYVLVYSCTRLSSWDCHGNQWQLHTLAGSLQSGSSNPLPVSDLHVTATTDTSITLAWTQVPDGTGNPAAYGIRYDSPALLWGDAWQTQINVPGSAIGASAQKTIAGLTPGSQYQFQLVPYRGIPDVNAVYGPLSSAVTTSTTGTQTCSCTTWKDVACGGTCPNKMRQSRTCSGSCSGYQTTQCVSRTSCDSTPTPSNVDNPNEPDGMTRIAEWDFCRMDTGSAGDGIHTIDAWEGNGFSMVNYDIQNYGRNHPNGNWWTLQSETNTGGEKPPPGPASPGCIGAMNWDAGDLSQRGQGGARPAVNEASGAFPFAGYRTVYMHYWMYHSTDWTHNGAFKEKIGYWRNKNGPDNSAFVIMMMNGVPGNPNGHFSINMQGFHSAINTDLFTCLQEDWPAEPPYYRSRFHQSGLNQPGGHDNEIGDQSSWMRAGEWHSVEIVGVMNTDNQCNAEWHFWIDGTKGGQFTNEMFRVPGSTNWNVVDLEGIWGGLGDIAPASDQERYFDHIYVSASNSVPVWT